MSEVNKTLARRSWEFLDNPDILEEVYVPDLVWHEPDQDLRGYEEARQFVSMYKTAFPDLRATVEDTIAEGDKVVTRYTVRGTHHTPHRGRQDSRGVGTLRQSGHPAPAGARPRTEVGQELAACRAGTRSPGPSLGPSRS